MELFGIYFAIPIAFILGMGYSAFLVEIRQKLKGLRSFLLIISTFILGIFLLEILLLATPGIVRSRAVVGPAFSVVHGLLFFLAPPALGNVLVLRGRKSFIGKWYIAGILCAVMAIFLVFLNFSVSEALYGVNGNTGPYSREAPMMPISQ